MNILEQIQALLAGPAAAQPRQQFGASGSWGDPVAPQPQPNMLAQPAAPSRNLLTGGVPSFSGSLVGDLVDRMSTAEKQAIAANPNTLSDGVDRSGPLPAGVDPRSFAQPLVAPAVDGIPVKEPAPAAEEVTPLDEIEVVGNAKPKRVPLPLERPADMGGGNLMTASLRRSVPNGQISSPSIAPAKVDSVSPTIGAPASGGGGVRLFSGMSDDMRERLRSLLLGMASGRDMNESFRNAALFMASGEEKGRARGLEAQARQSAVAMGMDPNVAKGLDAKSLQTFMVNQQLMNAKRSTPDMKLREVGGSLYAVDENNPTGVPKAIIEAPKPAPMTAEERAKWGIPATDTRPYIMDNGKPSVVGGGGVNITLADQAGQRRDLLVQQGLDPNTPENKQFILTGKMANEGKQVTAGDREAIRAADDNIQAAQSALTTLGRMKELSGSAYEGPTAGARATVTANAPTWTGLYDKGGEDTIELDNASKELALGQLKSIFGAAPTEGERQILLEIQGAANQPKAVRDRIYDRAEQAIRRRMQFNQDRANELRGGTYYDPKQTGGATAGPRVRNWNPATGTLD